MVDNVYRGQRTREHEAQTVRATTRSGARQNPSVYRSTGSPEAVCRAGPPVWRHPLLS